MTKQDVITQVSERTGLDGLTSRSVIESFFEVVKDALTEGEPIYIRTFGSFLVKQRASKIARNISQNTAVRIAAHVVPSFKASREFADQVRAQAVTGEKGIKREHNIHFAPCFYPLFYPVVFCTIWRVVVE